MTRLGIFRRNNNGERDRMLDRPTAPMAWMRVDWRATGSGIMRRPHLNFALRVTSPLKLRFSAAGPRDRQALLSWVVRIVGVDQGVGVNGVHEARPG